MQEISATTKNLPQTIEEKTAYVLFGSDALNAYRKKLKAVQTKYGISSEQYKQIQLEAQETAENLLLFSADIGKEMQKIKTAQGFASSIPDADGKNAETKTQTIHSMGFTDRQARDFQTLAKHPEIVEKAISEAREAGEIVTRQSVFDKIVTPTKRKNPIKQAIFDAQEEHEAFTENKTQGIVDFAEAQKDKINTELLAENAKVNIYKALKQVGDIGFMKLETLEDMAQSLTEEEANELENKISNAIDVLLMISKKIKEAR